jgi:flagellar biosynthesis/type III secretory pathway protein FliH
MSSQAFIRRALAAATCAVLTLGPAAAFGAQREGNLGTAVPRNGDWNARTSSQQTRAYDTGLREGLRQGEVDARGNRAANFDRNDVYRSADRGYDPRYGSRDAYRSDFRRGFAVGYRQGYDGIRAVPQSRSGDWRDARWTRGYQEPAISRGYSDGYAKGVDDGRDRDRYDAVGHREYRSADNGYYRDYGSKDTYKNNYRDGFRQGYEDGYRDGNRTRR